MIRVRSADQVKLKVKYLIAHLRVSLNRKGLILYDFYK